jgi:hypothetical protein
MEDTLTHFPIHHSNQLTLASRTLMASWALRALMARGLLYRFITNILEYLLEFLLSFNRNWEESHSLEKD